MRFLHFVILQTLIALSKFSPSFAEPTSELNPLEPLFNYIDENQPNFIEQLQKAVSIPSVSPRGASRSTHTELWNMITFIQDKLISLGFSVKLRALGSATSPQMIRMDDGLEVPLPPVILASLGSSPDKETLLIYGHLDVQPAKQSDGWDSDPFVLTPKDGSLYGRGATDDKGPVLGWLHAIQAFVWSGIEIPVNLKFVLESGEEQGSVGLADALREETDSFLANISMIAISDNYWVGQEDPCLTYGLRGLLPFELLVEGGSHDLHSGIHGGAVYEPMDDLIWILGSLKGSKGQILAIPGVMDDVDTRTPEERGLYSQMQFTLEKYKNSSGNPFLLYPDSKEDTLMARWRYPSLSIHGIEGAFSDPGYKTIIPSRVRGKFSLRLVPHQDPAKVGEAVKAFLEKRWEERGSPNKFLVKPQKSGKPWLGDVNNKNYRSAAAAISKVYGKMPQYTREGGSIPIVFVLEEVTGAGVMMMPMGQANDGAHSQNEKISVRNYIEGTKVFAAYLIELGK